MSCKYTGPEYTLINGRGLDALIGDTLIQYSRDDTHMTVYNPTEKLLELLQILAQSEGLFVWKPEGSIGKRFMSMAPRPHPVC